MYIMWCHSVLFSCWVKCGCLFICLLFFFSSLECFIFTVYKKCGGVKHSKAYELGYYDYIVTTNGFGKYAMRSEWVICFDNIFDMLKKVWLIILFIYLFCSCNNIILDSDYHLVLADLISCCVNELDWLLIYSFQVCLTLNVLKFNNHHTVVSIQAE